MTESCRLITEEQYQEYQLLKKKLEIATKALKDMPEMSRAQRALKEMEEE